jgi:hypothetical protein
MVAVIVVVAIIVIVALLAVAVVLLVEMIPVMEVVTLSVVLAVMMKIITVGVAPVSKRMKFNVQNVRCSRRVLRILFKSTWLLHRVTDLPLTTAFAPNGRKRTHVCVQAIIKKIN